LTSSGTLYGTTTFGGESGKGATFAVTSSTSGYSERLLYSFNGGKKDVANPEGGVISDSQGNLFGTGQSSGTKNRGGVFKLSAVGAAYKESLLYSFKGGKSDGFGPITALTEDGAGNLYGTTPDGGTYSGGIAFELSPPSSGKKYIETILVMFDTKSGGGVPKGGLLLGAGNVLYGTALEGGTDGVGVAFKVTI
jgi:uncharacterized repeat protein (TIGR03803 family)